MNTKINKKVNELSDVEYKIYKITNRLQLTANTRETLENLIAELVDIAFKYDER